MSKLDKLIAKLCPDGIEYKTTKDIIVNHTPIISKNVLGLLEKTNG